MKRFKDVDRLQKILDAITTCEPFLALTDRKTFFASESTKNAVCWVFVRIGRIAEKLSAGIHSQYPEIPWNKLISMGTSLTCNCYDIDFNIVWDSAKNDLPVLKSYLPGIIAKLRSSGPPAGNISRSEGGKSGTIHQLDELKKHREEIYEIARRNKALKVYVFGSCARKEETPESDVDFLVEFQKGASLFDHSGLYYDLSHFLKRSVDVIDIDGLKKDSEFERSVKEEMILL